MVFYTQKHTNVPNKEELPMESGLDVHELFVLCSLGLPTLTLTLTNQISSFVKSGKRSMLALLVTPVLLRNN